MVPEQLFYTKEHVWVKVTGESATIGITDFAQNELGDINFVELPAIGKKLGPNDTLASIESVKSATEVYAPVSGEVSEVNSILKQKPALLNSAPYEAGWICRLRLDQQDEVKKLLRPADYQSFLDDIQR